MSLGEVIIRFGVPMLLAFLTYAIDVFGKVSCNGGAMDKYLLDAMREVDAMLPGTPRISPDEEPYERANRIFGHRVENSGIAMMVQRDYSIAMAEAMRNGAGMVELNCKPSDLANVVVPIDLEGMRNAR